MKPKILHPLLHVYIPEGAPLSALTEASGRNSDKSASRSDEPEWHCTLPHSSVLAPWFQ